MNDGGPAFPGVVGEEGRGNLTQQILPDGRSVFVEHAPGMSLRDWFAGLAMQSCYTGEGARMVASRDGRYDGRSNWAFIVASNSYEMADAMLLQRSGKTADKTAGEAVSHILSILEEKDAAGVDIEVGSTALKSLIRWAREANAALNNS